MSRFTAKRQRQSSGHGVKKATEVQAALTMDALSQKTPAGLCAHKEVLWIDGKRKVMDSNHEDCQVALNAVHEPLRTFGASAVRTLMETDSMTNSQKRAARRARLQDEETARNAPKQEVYDDGACHALTKKQTLCKRKAVIGTPFCSIHTSPSNTAGA